MALTKLQKETLRELVKDQISKGSSLFVTVRRLSRDSYKPGTIRRYYHALNNAQQK